MREKRATGGKLEWVRIQWKKVNLRVPKFIGFPLLRFCQLSPYALVCIFFLRIAEDKLRATWTPPKEIFDKSTKVRMLKYDPKLSGQKVALQNPWGMRKPGLLLTYELAKYETTNDLKPLRPKF
jgi:hypothetical protein